MRVVAIIFAALLTLGLAAFGVVAAQKPSDTGSLIALAEHFLSPAQAAKAPAVAGAQANQTQAAQVSPAEASVINVSQVTGAAQPATAPAKLVIAQNSAAAAPAPPAPTPAPANAGTSLWPTTLPQCSNPDALGMSRIVQIDTTGGPAFGTEHFKQYDFL
ncbi:MAG: hypothetical protein WA199_03455, partial [Xanthobacteraceae bacterium]